MARQTEFIPNNRETFAAGNRDRARFAVLCRVASVRGADYLISQQHESGRIGSEYILDYYKAPRGLVAAGRCDEAWRLLDWIKVNVETAPGQFHAGDDQPQLLRSSTYRNTFIMMAALQLGRFDIINHAALENFRGYQHPEVGAFYGEQHFHPGVDFNTNHTGMSALFCLYAGLDHEAVAAGRYILKHLTDQPDIDRIFYVNTDTAGRLITTFDASDAFWRTVDYSRKEGHFWAIGTAVALLVQLFSRTGDEKFVTGARTLMRLTYRLAPGFEAWASSGKLAWGAARLYAATREEEFAAMAQHIGQRCFLDVQHDDGSWGPFYLRMGADMKGYETPVLELTSEFTLLTAELAQCLSC